MKLYKRAYFRLYAGQRSHDIVDFLLQIVLHPGHTKLASKCNYEISLRLDYINKLKLVPDGHKGDPSLYIECLTKYSTSSYEDLARCCMDLYNIDIFGPDKGKGYEELISLASQYFANFLNKYSEILAGNNQYKQQHFKKMLDEDYLAFSDRAYQTVGVSPNIYTISKWDNPPSEEFFIQRMKGMSMDDKVINASIRVAKELGELSELSYLELLPGLYDGFSRALIAWGRDTNYGETSATNKTTIQTEDEKPE